MHQWSTHLAEKRSAPRHSCGTTSICDRHRIVQKAEDFVKTSSVNLVNIVVSVRVRARQEVRAPSTLPVSSRWRRNRMDADGAARVML